MKNSLTDKRVINFLLCIKSDAKAIAINEAAQVYVKSASAVPIDINNADGLFQSNAPMTNTISTTVNGITKGYTVINSNKSGELSLVPQDEMTINAAALEAQRKRSKPHFNWEKATPEDLKKFVRANPQNSYQDPNFRRTARHKFRVKPSTSSKYKNQIVKLLEFHNVHVSIHDDIETIVTKIHESNLSEDQLEEWMWKFFFDKDKVWTTVDGYLSAVKHFYTAVIPEYFLPNHGYDQSRAFFRQMFPDTPKRTILLEGKRIKCFLTFCWEQKRPGVETYYIECAALGATCCLRISDLERIELENSQIFLDPKHPEHFFLELHIRGAKNAHFAESQRIFLQTRKDQNQDMINPIFVFQQIQEWRKATATFGYKLFTVPRKFGFSKAKLNKHIQNMYVKWKLAKEQSNTHLPKKMSVDILRKSMIKAAITEFGLTPTQLTALTRHKNTGALRKNYLTHYSTTQNRGFGEALANL